MKFDEALKKLEKIVEEMESGEMPLERSISKYEEGMKLVSFCTQKLNEVEKKIEVVTKNKNGGFDKKIFNVKNDDKKNSDEINDNADNADDNLSSDD